MYTSTIDFNSSASVFLRWPDFKPLVQSKSLSMQYIARSDAYTVFAFEGNIVYRCDLIFTSHSSDIPAGQDYTQAQNDIDVADFEANFQNTCNKAVASNVSIGDVPKTVDGRWINSPNAFPSWVTLYFTGRADDTTNGIGQGPHFQMSSDTVGDGYVTWQFNDIVFVLGATIIFTGAMIGDTLDYTIYAIPTTTGIGTTQVNLVNIGPGNIIIPTSGTGTTTIDLTKAIPVPNQTNTGFWDCTFSPTGWGTVSPNITQTGSYDLFDFQITLAHPAVEVPLIGNSKVFDLLVESVTSMQVLPQWTHKAVLHNSGHTGLVLGWTLSVGRAKTV